MKVVGRYGEGDLDAVPTVLDFSFFLLRIRVFER